MKGAGTHLARANLVKGDKRKGLRHHRGGEVPLRHDEGDQHGGEQELGDEGEGLGSERGQLGGVAARGEVEEDVVGGEVVAVVDAGDVVEEGVR